MLSKTIRHYRIVTLNFLADHLPVHDGERAHFLQEAREVVYNDSRLNGKLVMIENVR